MPTGPPKSPSRVSFDTLLLASNLFQFILINVLTNPVVNGTYNFDITTYDSDGITILDSYSQFFVAQANSLASFSVQSIPKIQG
jgi:hypothetical protein